MAFKSFQRLLKYVLNLHCPPIIEREREATDLKVPFLLSRIESARILLSLSQTFVGNEGDRHGDSVWQEHVASAART